MGCPLSFYGLSVGQARQLTSMYSHAKEEAVKVHLVRRCGGGKEDIDHLVNERIQYLFFS
ncbi:hypothetical protein SADUNF_Sadunf02G0157200 [Salix dunnii]|uniref:Uncharacterized protein n=1 Tax=Salix dunnii TaxID=1413687 RepID=A0A835N7X2_9ROSI|nr:hypothetical protein SADUNF_Sadunf02G0157200 [Salix dunnii]